MVKLIAGLKGTGKSKQVVKTANEHVLNAKGNIIYIDDDNRPMHELDHKIRFIDVSELPICIATEFYGFISGIIASNYDIEHIYIDGVFNKVEITEANLAILFERIEELSNKYRIDFTITLNVEETTPASLQKYL
ncbi:MAG: hypothetical protein Q4A41_03205 [Bacillota bacterium]|nr:hypothetical protein [Bacillota bacterium]